MKKQRPVNLDLTTMKFPASARASILHRVSGVAMFFALLFVLWAWATSLSSPEGYALVVDVMQGIFGKIVIIGTLSALSYHIIGGLRHMVMDMGHWEELSSGNLSANIAIALWLGTTALVGALVW